MDIEIHPKTLEKLQEKHNVTSEEVIECIGNVNEGILEDTRIKHDAGTKTFWFIAETDNGRFLKIIFIKPGGTFIIKSAYEPSDEVIQLYRKLTRR